MTYLPSQEECWVEESCIGIFSLIKDLYWNTLCLIHLGAWRIQRGQENMLLRHVLALIVLIRTAKI